MSVNARKVVILGAGRVGGGCGISLVLRGDAEELVFIDIDEKKALAQALDLCNVVSYLPKRVKVRNGDYSDCRDAGILVLSAGVTRLPGQSRAEEFGGSMSVITKVTGPIKESGFSGVLLCITNPADVICDYVRKNTGIERTKIISTGTAIDSTRLRHVISQATGIAPASIQAWCMGEHGPTQMVPWSSVRINGISLTDLQKRHPDKFGKLDFDELLKASMQEGADIPDGKGITEFGIGYTVSEVVSAILCDQHSVLPISVLLDGEYGQRGVHASVPCVLGKNGVEQIIEMTLTPDEKAKFDASCDAVRAGIERADNWKA